MIDSERKAQMQGHRQRVRERLMTSGFSNDPDYLVLEYLLFYGIPRKDTKVIAKRLIAKFGSLPGVFDAPISDLLSIPDMTYNAASLLHTLPEICAAYQKRRLQENKILSSKQLIAYLRTVVPTGEESLYLICLDAHNNFICSQEFSHGTEKDLKQNTASLLACALEHNAKKVFLAHNHPSGVFDPSSMDIGSTALLKEKLESVGVTLVDHVIVTAQGFYSMAQKGCGPWS